MPHATETHPLSDFLENHQAHIARLKETGVPEILTVNGEMELVILDAESYQEMVCRLERAEVVAAIREGIAAAERGEMKPAEQVYAEMRTRYGIHG